MRTSVAVSIGDDPEKRQLDQQCKIVLSHKSILSRILQRTVTEMEAMDTGAIMASIEGSPQAGGVSVLDLPEKITGENTEAASFNEGNLYYDIRFYTLFGENDPIKLLFDVEAQKDYYPGYKIVIRGIVYCARMISSQIYQEFDPEHYDGLKKVYSIWICFNSPVYIGNSISRYSMEKKDLIPGIPDEKYTYDKLEVIQICLREDMDQKNDPLIQMLNTLFSSTKTKEEIKKELSEQYGIVMDTDYGKEIDKMCNLSDMFEERGMKRGMETGKLEQARETALRLQRMRYDMETISEIVDVPVKKVKEWLLAEQMV